MGLVRFENARVPDIFGTMASQPPGCQAPAAHPKFTPLRKSNFFEKTLLLTSYVKYRNLEGQFRQAWVHNEEMLFSDSNVKVESSDCILNNTLPVSPEFNRIEYKKLLCKFEQLTAEKWCNTRRMIANLNKDSGLDLRDEFEKFAERCSNNKE